MIEIQTCLSTLGVLGSVEQEEDYVNTVYIAICFACSDIHTIPYPFITLHSQAMSTVAG